MAGTDTTSDDTTSDSSPLTLSEAVRAFSDEPSEDIQQDQAEDDDAADGTDDADNTDLAGDDAGGEDDDDADEGDDDDQAQDDDDAASEDDDAESAQGRFVGDDARVKLPDGTFTTVAELKAGNLKNADYTQKTQALSAKEKEVETEREQTTQLKQETTQLRDFSVAVLQSFLPPLPDEAMWKSDPFKAGAMEREHKARAQQLAYLQSEMQSDQTKAATKQQEEAKTLANREWAALVEAMPKLKDEKTRGVVVAGLFEYGQKQGFSEQEIRSGLAFDHRQAVILDKAMSWDKLQAEKAKLTKTKVEGRPPVQKGSKRLGPNGQKARTAKVAMARLDETGSFKDGLKAYLASS